MRTESTGARLDCACDVRAAPAASTRAPARHAASRPPRDGADRALGRRRGSMQTGTYGVGTEVSTEGRISNPRLVRLNFRPRGVQRSLSTVSMDGRSG